MLAFLGRVYTTRVPKENTVNASSNFVGQYFAAMSLSVIVPVNILLSNDFFSMIS